MVIRLNKAEKTTQLLAFMLNWNAISGAIAAMSRLPGLAFLSAFQNITVAFSLVFLALSVLFTITDAGSLKCYVIMAGWFFLFAFSYLLNPGIGVLAPRAFIYFANNVFCIALLLQNASDIQAFIDISKKYIFISVIWAALQWIVGTAEELYSMAFSYGTMLPMLLCLLLTLRQKKGRIWLLFALILLLVTNFRYGSRGSFVCCGLALILNYFLSSKKDQLIYLTLGLIALFSVLIFWEGIIAFLVRLFPGSRNVIILSQGNLFYVSGRDVIYRRVLEKIAENPFAIRGLYSDRLFLSSASNDINKLWGSYSHNIFLELLFQWGIWAVPAIVLLCAKMIALFRRSKTANEEERVLLILVYSFSIGQLLISSSYLIAPSFGLLLGILFWSKRHRTQKFANRSREIAALSE